MGLASCRPSRVPVVLNVLARRRRPTHPLEWSRSPSPYQSEVAVRKSRTDYPWRRCILDAVAASVQFPPLEIGIQAVSLSPYHAGLAGRYLQRLPVSPAFPTCSCPLGFHHQVSRMTQKHSSELLLTASGIQHRVPRRTLSSHTAHERGNFTGNFPFTNSTDFTVVSLRIRWLPLYRCPHPPPQGLGHVRGFPAFRLLCPI